MKEIVSTPCLLNASLQFYIDVLLFLLAKLSNFKIENSLQNKIVKLYLHCSMQNPDTNLKVGRLYCLVNKIQDESNKANGVQIQKDVMQKDNV